ncbi:MAG: hypothetical protein GEV28_01125 [Actinophytocola sp.]|uniref:hypothetical protein n=1 Tax=Actinophytocola sp. TaxID=1872138 RepID=UPI001325F638|nr:hypothetical protein [Actinophytocola sp.]MPZ79064.1 hypothetical protein [Actinophytocola sp.]
MIGDAGQVDQRCRDEQRERQRGDSQERGQRRLPDHERETEHEEQHRQHGDTQQNHTQVHPASRRAPMPDQPADFFHEMSAAALARPEVATGTRMGFPCLRVAGAFFASCDHRTGDLFVKLSRDRVEQLIADGVGKPFAPADRTFREWVLIADREETRWAELVNEARAFASRPVNYTGSADLESVAGGGWGGGRM